MILVIIADVTVYFVLFLFASRSIFPCISYICWIDI